MFRLNCFVPLLLSSLSVLCPQAETQQIKALAEETSKALVAGHYGRVVDLTYPKLVELIGGRARMVGLLEKGRVEMKARGHDFVSVLVHSPGEIQTIGTKRLSIIPYTLKMKVEGGVVTTDCYMIGVSEDAGDRWSFIDGTNLDDAKLTALIPDAAGKIKLPANSPPVFQKSP